MRANKSIKILSLIGLACTLTGVLFAGSSANGRPIESAFYNPTPARVQTVAVSGWKAKWQNLKLEAKQAANKWEARLQRKWQTFRTAYATKVSNSRMPASISKAKAAPQLTPAQKEFSQIIKQTKKITKQSAIQVVTPARPGTTALPKTESGVPVFSFQHVVQKNRRRIVIRVKNIPKLDIGREKSISAAELLPTNLVVALSRKKIIKKLQSPPMPSWVATRKIVQRKLANVTAAISPMRGGLKIGEMVTKKRIDAVSLAMLPTKPLSALKPVKPFSPDELTMLAAAIYFQKGNKCHIVSGLLTDLATKPEFSEEANYDLGICAYKMGFYTEEVSRLLNVVRSENPEYAPTAIADLANHLPREFDDSVGPVLQNLKNPSLIPPSAKDNVDFVLARYEDENGEFEKAVETASAVTQKSPYYADAQYLRAIGLYASKRVKKAESVLVRLRTWMRRTGYHSNNLEGLIAMNLGRMYFMQGRYQLAENEYMKVPKNNPLWIEALIEQGWSQLDLGDNSGAIGNMYSLQSPFFKLVYKPESWVVRTIGYIDICQYGDAYHALSLMEKRYRTWQSDVQNYLADRKDPLAYYDTIKKYVRTGKSENNVDGLPYQVIRYIASRRGFLNDQNAVNNLINEANQYSYVYKILLRDQAGLTFRTHRTEGRLLKLKSEIASVRRFPQNMKYLNEWLAESKIEKHLLQRQEFEGQLYEQARRGYLKMQSMALAQIQRHKMHLVYNAGRNLVAELQGINHQLTQIFSGNEFLRYEIFAGSGQNIRYQVSGGAVQGAERIPASIKPDKTLRWHFEGEYWKDEIGYYRSMLPDVCAKNARSNPALAGAANAASKSE